MLAPVSDRESFLSDSMNQDAPQTPSDASEHDHASTPMQRRAYVLLKEMMQDGRVRPGEKLLEVQVARAFGISRSPARHALQALVADKLLRPSSGRGYVVAGRSNRLAPGQFATLEQSQLAPVARGDRVYSEVERDLCSAVLSNTVRITEERLAEHFRVSRTVARDVLSRMHSLGLIGKGRNGGWMAERVTTARIKDLYEMRWLLEPLALVQSAPLVSRDRLTKARDDLRHAIKHIKRADSALLARMETDLHVDLLALCPNQVLLRALDHTHLLLGSNQSMFDLHLGVEPAIAKTALYQHLAVIDHLLASDWSGAADHLCAHLKASCGVWLRRFDTVSAMTMPALPRYLTPLEGFAMG